MKKLILCFVVFSTVAVCYPIQSQAQHPRPLISGQDMDAEIKHRINPSDADIAISDREKSTDLMISNGYLVIQFSDKKLEKIHAEIRGDLDDAGDPHFVEVLRSALGSGVRTLLDRSLAIPMYEVSEVYYKDGRLHIISKSGEEFFKTIEVNNKPLMEQYSRRDARRFVAEAEKWLP